MGEGDCWERISPPFSPREAAEVGFPRSARGGVRWRKLGWGPGGERASEPFLSTLSLAKDPRLTDLTSPQSQTLGKKKKGTIMEVFSELP